MIVCISEVDRTDYSHKRYFVFEVPKALGAGYQQVRSYSSFFGGTKRNHSPKFFYITDHGDGRPWKAEGAPTIEVENIWAFYKAIGYDYKARKWLT